MDTLQLRRNRWEKDLLWNINHLTLVFADSIHGGKNIFYNDDNNSSFKCEYVEVFFLNIPCLYFMTFGSEMTENNVKRLPVSLRQFENTMNCR